MASKKIKKLYMEINAEGGSILSGFFKKNNKKETYNSGDIEILRKILSNEKSRILYFLKKNKPKSIYALAKLLERDFKSVYQDLKVLERFGFIEFETEKKGERESLKPVLLVSEVHFFLKI